MSMSVISPAFMPHGILRLIHTITMFENFSIKHFPTLFVAVATIFGGFVPFFNAEYAIEEFGLPKRIARVKEAQAIMVLSSARITAIDAAMFIFYF